MIKLRLLSGVLVLLTAAAQGQIAQVSGAWVESDLKWNKPPAELHLEERSAPAGILYFGPSNHFALVYGVVNQGPSWEILSHGDGQVIYLGTWQLDKNVLTVEYRLVRRTLVKENEKLPGPIEKKTLQLNGGVLLFEKTRFQRDKRLDDQMLAVWQGESANAGRPGQP
jgi:hypothetical protein